MRHKALPSSFRGRFLLVVLFVAVMPLALIGLMLTRTVSRAGEDLLRSELDQSLDRLSAVIEQRWSYRRGELELLARNEPVTRLLAAGTSGGLQTPDSEYFAQLFGTLSRGIPAFEYHDAEGRVLWSSPAPPRDTMNSGDLRLPPSTPDPTITIHVPIVSNSGGVRIGEVVGHVSVASLLQIETTLPRPNGAELQIRERSDDRWLLPSLIPELSSGLDRFTIDDADWLAVQRPLDDPEITLILAAPLGAYVQPFEHAARTGAITLMVVALLALLLSAFLTARLTASLERLAVAAAAVAAGDLEHRVDDRGSAEIGRVARAFNTMTQSLRLTLGELSQRKALAAVGEYAASLSHEVRNGLTAIRIDLQRAEEKGPENPASSTLVARALENVQRLDAIIGRSLRGARGDRVPPRRVDLQRVLANATQAAESAFIERGVVFDAMSHPEASMWTLGDAVALEQLFLNLLLNAAQALPPGGRAAVAIGVEGLDARIVVSNMGTIPPEELAQVLDPFFSTKAKGTGFGLPIARQIARSHGGSLRIESTPESGTRVEVRLPLAAPPT